VLFNSLVFAAFLAVVLPVWRGLPLAAGRWWLLAASLVFYGWWSPAFLGLLLATATLDWLLARGMEGATDGRRRLLVTLSVTSNLGSLAVFKYLGFFSRELAAALEGAGVTVAVPTLSLVLPVGISFYTFQAIAYSVDVYRGRVAAIRALPDFLLFLTFFPQLVAGPIERSAQLAPQLAEMRRPRERELQEAAWLLAWGYVKKLVVADNLAPLVAEAFDRPGASAGTIVLACYAFTWQIYGDFSGYSDIARGLARLFGVDLMENFRRPFLARSPQDLWRRWHVSLSQWLRDYLYIPLGGNRTAPTRNLLLTMILGGLWHGANWTFLGWGAWHGVALAVGRRLRGASRSTVVRLLGVVGTFHLTMLGFVLFRAHSLSQVGDLARGVLHGGRVDPDDPARAMLLVAVTVPVLAVEVLQERLGEDSFLALRAPRVVQGALYVALAALVTLLGSSHAARFLYFQF
jgi:alginate O-acetyltransferase complex protein AlgI